MEEKGSRKGREEILIQVVCVCVGAESGQRTERQEKEERERDFSF